MDERVKKALAQWPNVPDVYGWLALDRHGHWLLRGEEIRHPNVRAFINRNYLRQADGAYAFQNGPQKVHVQLALTPYIAHLSPAGDWSLHTGEALDQVEAVYLDGNGQLLLHWQAHVAALDDRDLLAALEKIVDAQGCPLNDSALEAALDGAAIEAFLEVGQQRLPIRRLKKNLPLGEHFHFIARPER